MIFTVAGGAHRTHSPMCSSPRGRRSAETDSVLVRERDQLRQGVVQESAWRMVPRRCAGFVSGALHAIFVCSGLARIVVRNCELRNASEHGDAALIAKLGSLMSQGSALLSTSSGDDLMDEKSKSSKMCSLIDAADTKRRC